jgi:glycosyltransferase involved in cell wall biosynthesis
MAAPPPSPITPALRAIPEGYDVARGKLMGRQSAGHGFLRILASKLQGPLYGYGESRPAVTAFETLLRQLKPDATLTWVRHDPLGRLGERGVLYLADPALAPFGRMRLRAGPAAFCLCGVTHTISSGFAMEELAALPDAPLMPWDALICTSRAAKGAVETLLAAKAEYLRWRLGPDARPPPLELPVIPLGVHSGDFAFADAERAQARAALGLAEDDVAALFVGRLVFHAKAHPAAMLAGLQAAAERSGRPVVLIIAGRFHNATIEKTFREAPARYAPSVRTIFVGGGDETSHRHGWAAADLFVSLADSVQESFGLTPIEAMAAGLPCVLSDWDGYRDTVRHGVEGFLIPTWAPAPGAGTAVAASYEAEAMDYDRYSWATTASTAVDLGELADRLTDLIADPELRRRMGAAGRERARSVYDWSVVYAQYQALWGELNTRRLAALQDPAQVAALKTAPQAYPSALDPFRLFEGYPTRLIGADTVLWPTAEASPEALAARMAEALFSALASGQGDLERLLAAALAASDGVSVGRAAGDLRRPLPALIRAAGVLAKMGLVRLGDG